ALADGKTVFGGCDGLLHVISVADGKQIKEIEAGAYVAASVALAGNHAYFGHYENEFLCIDLCQTNSAAEPASSSPAAPKALEKSADLATHPAQNQPTDSAVVWRYKNREFAYMSSAAITADRVIVGGRDKLLHCLNRANGQKIWTFATQGKVDSSPVVAGDKVVVGSADGRFYMVSLKTGKELWSYEIGRPIESSPAVAAGKIVIGSEDGYVYCFGEKKNNLSEKLGGKIETEGIAVDSKMGACIVNSDLTIWIDGKDLWPGALHNRRVLATGILIERNDLPVFIPKSGEPLVAGIPVEAGTNLQNASHRFLIRDAVWKLKEK
ncbi:MAG: PQQ-binding-like beta-propeller repeat protein, partial [Verrucomicrobiota bacterium]